MSWVRVPGPGFIGPFPSKTHAQEFIERRGLRVAAPVETPEAGPVDRYSLKEAEAILKTAPGWFE